MIAGYWIDPSNVYHGFVRRPAYFGMITSFDVPGAGTGPGQGTAMGTVDNLNSAGDISGNYVDPNNVYHGYLRTSGGIITAFDAPGAGTGPTQGTQCSGINDTRTIVGAYTDTNNVNHGFLRASNGTFTSPIEVLGAGTGPGQGTNPFCNNPAGAITGWYIDSSNVFHGFLRSP